MTSALLRDRVRPGRADGAFYHGFGPAGGFVVGAPEASLVCALVCFLLTVFLAGDWGGFAPATLSPPRGGSLPISSWRLRTAVRSSWSFFCSASVSGVAARAGGITWTGR